MWSLREFDQDARALELDIVRCRRNALCHAPCDFSCFCPPDNIVPAKEGELADFSYIVATPVRRSALTMLPYTAPGWYHRIAAEFLLHHRVIMWADIH